MIGEVLSEMEVSLLFFIKNLRKKLNNELKRKNRYNSFKIK